MKCEKKIDIQHRLECQNFLNLLGGNMVSFVIFRILGYCIIIYDIRLIFLRIKPKKKNLMYVPGYINFYALFFFLCYSIIFIMSFNYQRISGYNIGNWVGGIMYLIFTSSVGTVLLMFSANWRLLILEDPFECCDMFGRKKIIMFRDIDKDKSFYKVVKNPHLHLEYQNHTMIIQNWCIQGDFKLLYNTLTEIGIRKLNC